MYKITFYKIVWEENPDNSTDEFTEQTLLYFDIELPFPPYPGLEVLDSIYEGLKDFNSSACKQFESGVINEVSWLNDEKRFACFTENLWPNHPKNRLKLNYSQLIDKYLELGWYE